MQVTTAAEWEAVKLRFLTGTVLEGEVAYISSYGVWIDLGIGIPGLLHATDAGLNSGQRLNERFQIGQALRIRVAYCHARHQYIALDQPTEVSARMH